MTTRTSDRRLEARRDPLLTEKLVYAIGPQHPSLPAPVELSVQCDGELIERVTPECGFMHRGVERIAQARPWAQLPGLLSRCEWLAGHNADYLVAAAVEQLAGTPVPERAQWLRMIALEVSRLVNHLFWWGNLGVEAGAYSPIFFAMRELEPLLDLLEQLSGSRWHHQWIVPGGVRTEAPERFLRELADYLPYLEGRIDAYEDFFSDNAIWVNRSELIGTLELDHALAAGASGPVLRASGGRHDLRRDNPYLFYGEVEFEVPLGEHGDTLDRYRVRMFEMRQSIQIIRQCLERLPGGAVSSSGGAPAAAQSAEADGGTVAAAAPWQVPKGEAYVAVESPRGELGLLVVADGGLSPARVHLRPPSLYHLFLLDELCRGYLLADLFVIYGSLDIMMGEVDR